MERQYLLSKFPHANNGDEPSCELLLLGEDISWLERECQVSETNENQIDTSVAQDG
jgi:hypothetical protein